MPHRLAAAVAALVASAVLASPAAAAPTTLRPDDVVVTSKSLRCKPTSAWLSVGGKCGFTTRLRFDLDGEVVSARLKLRPYKSIKTPITVTSGARRIGTLRNGAALDVSDAVEADRLALTLSSGRKELRIARTGAKAPALLVTIADPDEPGPPEDLEPIDDEPDADDTGRPSFPQVDAGTVWVAPAELAALPTSGSAWTRLKTRADGSLGGANIADQSSNHDVGTLAAALVYARTGEPAYRAKAQAAILGAIGTEDGGRTLALGRNLASYVIAADLIDLDDLDPAGDALFRTWLADVRTETLDGMTLISTHERRPNNWGTMAGASRIAADLYLGDQADLARAAAVFRGYLGDRSAYAGFDYGDLSWQSNAAAPVGINPRGATIAGVDVDGALPDEMRRGCAFQLIPCHTGYAWEAMQGVIVQAELLSRHGFDAFRWSDDAILRAAQYLHRLDGQFGGWWASSDDTWQPWLINHAYGTSLPAGVASPGKLLGFADWLYGS